MTPMPCLDSLPRRRALARLSGLAGAGLLATAAPARAQAPPPLTRPIPKTGELLPLVGLGSWITFNVGADRAGREASYQVIRAFFDEGGRLIDSSPMYGSSQPVIGEALARLQQPQALFSAEKVWTGDAARGPAQMEATRAHWGVPRLDLMQVHNLLAWEQHLPRLLEMKAAGRLRYVGVSTSEGRRHAEIERVMRQQPIDFVQLSLNLLDRDAALGRQRQLARHPLPGWAAEIGCRHWAQVALKFVVSHPAVTCAIPATSRVEHLRQNMAAARGPLPDAA
ncbi:MAG: hypothetical protein RL227_1874, partial [Pseudomonadota bacterium]